MTDVATSNDVRVGQAGSSGYVLHQFKDYVGSTGARFTCELQTNYNPASSTVYLQIYNRNTTTWETLASNNTSPPDTDFTLTGTVANLTNYKDGSSATSCRVYQSAN